MDEILALGFGALAFLGGLLVAVAGMVRLAGRRSERLEQAARVVANAERAGIYPPSLRGAGTQSLAGTPDPGPHAREPEDR